MWASASLAWANFSHPINASMQRWDYLFLHFTGSCEKFSKSVNNLHLFTLDMRIRWGNLCMDITSESTRNIEQIRSKLYRNIRTEIWIISYFRSHEVNYFIGLFYMTFIRRPFERAIIYIVFMSIWKLWNLLNLLLSRDKIYNSWHEIRTQDPQSRKYYHKKCNFFSL